MHNQHTSKHYSNSDNALKWGFTTCLRDFQYVIRRMLVSQTDDARCIAFKLPRRDFFDKQTRIVAKVIEKKKKDQNAWNNGS